MNYGYMRLSKDDNQQNYISIENQKLIISQYVKETGEKIDEWYEDDGISGYKFDRPGFNHLLTKARTGDTIYAKDLSRIGRHNAKVLLLIEQLKEDGIRLYIIDERYDSENSDDDMLGITTWYNEKYIKNTSKKIKQVLHARQQEGTLYHDLPFGYVRDQKDKSKILIVPEEAEFIKKIFTYYIQGYGYRRTANILNENGVETPSGQRRKRELRNGIYSKKRVASKWTDSMVHDILKNDIYMGNFRLHKKARHTIHGKDIKVPKEEQYLFESNHEPIVSKQQFELAQEIMQKRIHSNYRGGRATKWEDNGVSLFGGCLFCSNCGRKLTPIKRNNKNGVRNYYICSTYNTRGKEYCEKSHLIEENNLVEDVIQYLTMYRNLQSESIKNYKIDSFIDKKDGKKLQKDRLLLQKEEVQQQIQIIVKQKIKDLTAVTKDDSQKMLENIYQKIQSELLQKIENIDIKLNALTQVPVHQIEEFHSALDILDTIIQNKKLDRTDIEILIDRIEIDANGMPTIQIRSGMLKSDGSCEEAELNSEVIRILSMIMESVSEEDGTFTLPKILLELEKRGMKKSAREIKPYLAYMMQKEVIRATSDAQTSFEILVSMQEWKRYLTRLHGDCSIRWYARDGI